MQKIRAISFLLEDKLASKEEAELYWRHTEKHFKDQNEIATHLIKMFESVPVTSEESRKNIREKIKVYEKLKEKNEVLKRNLQKKVENYIQSIEKL